jgi:hypothetical protein
MVRKRDRGQDFALGKYIQYCRKVQVPNNSFFCVVHVYWCVDITFMNFPLAALVSKLQRIKP